MHKMHLGVSGVCSSFRVAEMKEYERPICLPVRGENGNCLKRMRAKNPDLKNKPQIKSPEDKPERRALRSATSYMGIAIYHALDGFLCFNYDISHPAGGQGGQ